MVTNTKKLISNLKKEIERINNQPSISGGHKVKCPICMKYIKHYTSKVSVVLDRNFGLNQKTGLYKFKKKTINSFHPTCYDNLKQAQLKFAEKLIKAIKEDIKSIRKDKSILTDYERLDIIGHILDEAIK